MQRTETWIWKDKVETTTVEFWERFRDQDADANLYRNECFQLWIEKCKGAPFLRYSLRTFFESLKKKVFFSIRYLRQSTAEHTRRYNQQASGVASVGGEASTEVWIWSEGTCRGSSASFPVPKSHCLLPDAAPHRLSGQYFPARKGPDSRSFCGV